MQIERLTEKELNGLQVYLLGCLDKFRSNRHVNRIKGYWAAKLDTVNAEITRRTNAEGNAL